MDGFGSRFTELLKSQNLSEAKACKFLGVSQKTVNSWKNEKSFPDVLELKRISTYFNVTIDYLTTGKEYDYDKQLLLENYELKKNIKEAVKILEDKNIDSVIGFKELKERKSKQEK